MTEQREILCGRGEVMIKQPRMMFVNVSTANGQTNTLLSVLEQAQDGLQRQANCVIAKTPKPLPPGGEAGQCLLL
jgi:hypothetical protein